MVGQSDIHDRYDCYLIRIGQGVFTNHIDHIKKAAMRQLHGPEQERSSEFADVPRRNVMGALDFRRVTDLCARGAGLPSTPFPFHYQRSQGYQMSRQGNRGRGMNTAELGLGEPVERRTQLGPVRPSLRDLDAMPESPALKRQAIFRVSLPTIIRQLSRQAARDWGRS
jgi:hypothetical protein